MSEKKMVRRSVAIALGIICIILVAALGVVAYYVASRHHTDSEYNALQNQVNDLNDTLNLGKSTVWVNDQTVSQKAGSYYSWYWFTDHPWYLPYSGYISVQVLSSTTANTYVRAIYSVNGINYDNQISVGSIGTAVFPIVAPANLEIRVGNTNLVNGATETVTITYYY